MDDAVKALVEKLRGWAPDGLTPNEKLTLAWLDGEPARQQAACDRRAEEVREADANFIDRNLGGPIGATIVAGIRSLPLTATPLGDELRDEREVSQSLREQLIAAEAERDALRARVAELEEYKEKGDDVQIAAQRLKFWAENPHACPDHFGARTACGQCFDSERALRLASEADLREAHERLDEFGMKRDGTTATVVEGIAAMRAALCEYQRWAYEAEVARMDLREAVEELHDLCEQVRAGRGLDTLRARAGLAKHPVK